jgi:spore maturation protein SpmB
MGTFAGAIALVGGMIWAFESLGKETMQTASNLLASIILFGVIIVFILSAMRKKENVYDAFIDGAKDGFQTAIKIIPYLIAILVAIAMFRTSGAMDFLLNGLKHMIALTGLDTSWVDAMPTAIMKPLSGSGARGMMVEAMKTYGPDSFVGRLSGIFQGSTDTTFYLVAVYYGAVNIKNSRYTVPYALLADLAGVVTAILVGYLFFA